MQVTFHNPSNKKGFTIVEVVVAITVMTVLSVLLFGPLSDLFTSNTTSSTQSTQDTDTRGALRQIASDLTYANGFVGSIVSPATPTGSNNGTGSWNYAPATSTPSNNVDANTQILMAKLNATDQAYAADDRMPVGAGAACDLTQQIFVQNTYVYFVKSGTLYRRTMTNSPTAGTPCSGIAQKQSCQTLSASICEASDSVFLKNVTSFLVEFNNPTTSAATSARVTIRTAPSSITSPITPTEASITLNLLQQN